MKEIPELRVIEILKKNRIDFAATLPCDRIKALLPRIEENLKTIPLTREENGVGICAGLYLGGKRPIMVIQSTGIGNMIMRLNPLTSPTASLCQCLQAGAAFIRRRSRRSGNSGKNCPHYWVQPV